MKAIPMPGPLEADPAGTVDLATARAQLDEATSGLPLGAWDQQVIEQFGAMATPVIAPVSLIATVASWLRRARNAGVEAGRRGAVDTNPAVAWYRQVKDPQITMNLGWAMPPLGSALIMRR